MEDLHKAPPLPYRRIALVVSIVVGIGGAFISLPFVLCLWLAGVIVYYSAKEPGEWLALQQDEREREAVQLYNRFIDGLYAGGVLDDSTTPEDVTITSPAPLVYDIALTQVGKTAARLQRAAEDSIDALGCVDVTVDRTAPSCYRVTYSRQFPAERLAAIDCRFDALPPAVSIEALPIGVFEDGSPVTLNLESRNALIGGNPRSGKSVALAALLCGLCRCPHERVTVLSPKILDFQSFAPAVRLIQDPVEMLEYLDSLRAEAELRKGWCVAHHAKKISPRDYSDRLPHLTTIIDEFAVIRAATTTDDKGKTVKIGEQIQAAVFSLVAETGFSASSFVLAVQKASGASGISTDLRDLISGNRVSFATETPEATKMVLGDFAVDSPCHLITPAQKGVGYVSLDGQPPRCFRGALTTEEDEERATTEGIQG